MSSASAMGLAGHGLTVWKGDRRLISDLSLRVDSGQGLWIKGSNGSGKTSLLRVLCGLSSADEGSVQLDGHAIDAQRGLLAYSGHSPGLKLDLTLQENLQFWLALEGRGADDTSAVLAGLKLELCRDLPVRFLSAGQQRRTALARLLLSQRRLWLLDEPYTNLDEQGRDYINMRLGQHLEAGGLVVLASHSAPTLAADALLSITLEAAD